MARKTKDATEQPTTETDPLATDTSQPRQQTADDSSSNELGASFAQTNPPLEQ